MEDKIVSACWKCRHLEKSNAWRQAFMLLAVTDDGLETLDVTPQYPLFKKLLEWGFDVDLINETDEDE